MGRLIEGASSDARDTVVSMPITAGDSATYSAGGHSHRSDGFEAIAPGGAISYAVDLPGGPVPAPAGVLRAAVPAVRRPEPAAPGSTMPCRGIRPTPLLRDGPGSQSNCSSEKAFCKMQVSVDLLQSNYPILTCRVTCLKG